MIPIIAESEILKDLFGSFTGVMFLIAFMAYLYQSISKDKQRPKGPVSPYHKRQAERQAKLMREADLAKRVKCRNCNNMILKNTAQKNEGLCGRCVKGADPTGKSR